MVWPAAVIGFGPPVWSLAIVNDGVLRHWCGGRVCGWAWHLRGRNTCCVYQIYASVDVGLRGCVTDGVGPRFGNVQLAVATDDDFGGACQCPAPPPGNTSLTLMPVCVWLPVLVTTMV